MELTPITSKASICSVTLIVPILEVIKEPTFPAMITEMKVGANSKITDCLVAKPTKYFGIRGLFIFKAVCIVTTPPTKKEIVEKIWEEMPNYFITSSTKYIGKESLLNFIGTVNSSLKIKP